MPAPTHGIGPFADLSTPVTVHVPRRNRGLWHVDPACPRIPADGVAATGTAGQLPDELRTERRLTPCVRCTFPALLQAAVAHGGDRAVLLCPRWCGITEEDHTRCRRCTALRRLGDALGLLYAEMPRPRHYPVLLAPVHRALRGSLATRYAVLDVPAGVGPLTADALRVAWARRSDPRIPIAGIFVPDTKQYAPTFTLDLRVGELVTAPPAP